MKHKTKHIFRLSQRLNDRVQEKDGVTNKNHGKHIKKSNNMTYLYFESPVIQMRNFSPHTKPFLIFLTINYCVYTKKLLDCFVLITNIKHIY